MSKNNGNSKMSSLKQAEQAKRVNLAAWRASRLKDLELPSGLLVKLRDVTMTDLMLTGKLPDSIMSLITETAKAGELEFDLEMITKNTREWNEMLITLLELSMVEPQIGDVADDEHILLTEIPGDDKLFIFNYLNRGAEALQPFREGEEQPVEAV